ncbi:unnamed protein product (macronuclear) [Paramecium tetraurelia]|uniref:Cytochrome b5 heme-binding domain-containing protein n=1 Tax=Paramecium tetraurelia TaxID=5888 RepID=A0CY11_PARTE|nr:uncharacterized protein GSPATT00011310001 [Paramecium tetraurelia]CAK75678.1 unnamed protein product [Paramecium tetraurelia]|eukprot:XP_001443075.1 hypothetical protein (macronuclear) [Paramecium tetraurelia strain d4-2]
MNKSFKSYPSFAAFQIEQAKSNRLLYVYHNSVYDLTDFIDKHPGGRGPLNTYKGRDLENIFFNPAIHKHSQSAFNTFERYKCGIIENKPIQQQQQSMLGSKSTNVSQSIITNKSQKNTPQKNDSDKKLQQKSQSVKPKAQQQEDRLNQSMSKLNQSMTSSVKSQFLLIPTQQELLMIQKQKQQKLIKQWKQSEVEELKRQQAEVEKLRVEKNEDRKTQSEILVSTRKKSTNPYYSAWLEKQQQQEQQQKEESKISNILPAYLTQSSDQQVEDPRFQPFTFDAEKKRQHDSKLSQSVIVQKTQKKVNPYYEEWKRKQSLKSQESQKELTFQENNQLSKQQSIILEENESQISGQPSSINNSFQRSYSMSQRTIVQENPQLSVPIFAPKFISPIKAKFVISSSMQKL